MSFVATTQDIIIIYTYEAVLAYIHFVIGRYRKRVSGVRRS